MDSLCDVLLLGELYLCSDLYLLSHLSSVDVIFSDFAKQQSICLNDKLPLKSTACSCPCSQTSTPIKLLTLNTDI